MVVREIFTNGRMTRAQLVSKAKEMVRRRASAHSEPPSEDAIQKEIDEAIKSQYLRLATAEIRDAVERDMRKQNKDFNGSSKSGSLSDRCVCIVTSFNTHEAINRPDLELPLKSGPELQLPWM